MSEQWSMSLIRRMITQVGGLCPSRGFMMWGAVGDLLGGRSRSMPADDHATLKMSFPSCRPARERDGRRRRRTKLSSKLFMGGRDRRFRLVMILIPVPQFSKVVGSAPRNFRKLLDAL